VILVIENGVVYVLELNPEMGDHDAILRTCSNAFESAEEWSGEHSESEGDVSIGGHLDECGKVFCF